MYTRGLGEGHPVHPVVWEHAAYVHPVVWEHAAYVHPWVWWVWLSCTRVGMVGMALMYPGILVGIYASLLYYPGILVGIHPPCYTAPSLLPGIPRCTSHHPRCVLSVGAVQR